MPRPRGRRRVVFNPLATFFKPSGIPMRNLDVVLVSHEELESIRLKYVEGLDQNQIAERMETSQSTIQRLMFSANQKITIALVKGMAIRIES